MADGGFMAATNEDLIFVSCQTHCEEVGEGRCGSEDLQQVSCTAETVSDVTRLTLTLHL